MALLSTTTCDRTHGTFTFYARRHQTVEQVQCAFVIGRDIPGVPQIDFADGERMWRIGDQAVVEIDAAQNVMLRQFDAASFASRYWEMMADMAADSWRGSQED